MVPEIITTSFIVLVQIPFFLFCRNFVKKKQKMVMLLVEPTNSFVESQNVARGLGQGAMPKIIKITKNHKNHKYFKA